MSTRVIDTSSQHFTTPSPPVTDLPITFSIWARLPAATSSPTGYTLQSMGEAGTADHVVRSFINVPSAPVANWDVRAQHLSTSNGLAQTATGVLSLNTWIHIAARFDSNSARSIFVNGAKTTNTTSVNTPTIDHYYIGVLNFTSLLQYANAWLADAAVYDTNLSDALIAELAGGKSAPLVAPANLVHYRQLRGAANGEAFERGVQNLSGVNSPTFDATIHPTLIYPGAESPVTPNTSKNVHSAIRAQRAA